MSTQLALLLVGGAATFLFLMLALVGPRYRPRAGSTSADGAEISQASEIAADRDRLRAEHAVEVHRLERRMHRLEEVLAEVRIADARSGAPLLVLNSEEFADRSADELSLRADLKSAREEAQTARSAREELERRIAELTRERDRLANEGAAGRASELLDTGRLVAERDAALATLEERTRELETALNALGDVRREKDALAKSVAASRPGEDSEKQTARMAELERMAADRATLLKRREKDLAAALTRAAEAEKGRGEALARAETQLRELRAAEARVAELEKALAGADPALVAELRQRVASLEGALETTEQRLDATSGELDIARIERVASATRIEMLERLLSERSAANAASAGEAEAGLRAALELLQRDLETARSARAVAEEGRSAAEADVRRLSADLERLNGLASEAGRLRSEKREDEALRRRLQDVAADVVRLAAVLGEAGARPEAEAGADVRLSAKAGKV